MSLNIPPPDVLMALPSSYLAQDRSQVLFNVTVAIMVVTSFVYGLFLVSRVYHVKQNNLGTWILSAGSFTFCVGLWTMSFLLVSKAGAGRHLAYWLLTDITVIETYLKIQTAAEFVYVVACLLPKVFILLLYLDIFTDRWVRVCSWFTIGFCTANALANIIASFTICQPFEYKWNKTIPGHCADVMTSYRFVSVPNILSDIAILVLPLSTLSKLIISKRRKVGIFLTFLIGSLGIITAIMRFVNFWTIPLESDVTWYGTTLFAYSIIEPSAYFMCACFLSLRPLMRFCYIWTRTKVNSYYGSGTGTKGSVQSELSLRNLKGNHQTSISAAKTLSSRHDESKSHFIRLDESIDVDVSPRYGAERV